MAGPTPLRLIVAGGRDFEDYGRLSAAVAEALGDHPLDRVEIVSGAARGADRLGERWARENGVALRQFPADWNRYGKSAGYRRNEEMAGYADAVLVMPGGRGTDHMARIAADRGLTLHDFRTRVPGQAQALWSRDPAAGYEVSSAGDRRFSALYARLPDGRILEDAWGQAKGYPDGRAAKGKPALTPDFDYWGTYKGLWQQWADANPALMDELAEASRGEVLVDRFAKTENNQARALAEILVERGASMPEQPAAAVKPTGQQAPDAVQLQMSLGGQEVDAVQQRPGRKAGELLPWILAAGGGGLLGYGISESVRESDSLRGGQA